jgi:hypothetical protein
MAVGTAAVLLLAACGPDRPPAPRPMAAPWMQTGDFPDVPLPLGWQPAPDEDQLAVAIGGGGARRLRVVLLSPANREDLQPDQVMAGQVAGRLVDHGWVRSDSPARSDDLRQHWRKGSEALSVSAERSGGQVILSYRLLPAE